MRKKILLLIIAILSLFIIGCGEKEEPKDTYYKVILDLDGGAMVGETTFNVKEGDTLSLPTPEKDGYEFLGWGSLGNVYHDNIKVERNITLKALWDEVLIYSITYVLNGGTLVGEAKVEYRYPTVYVLPECVKDGYEFLGWYETSSFVTEKVTEIDESFSYDVTLYARFKKLGGSNPTITYNLDGGYFLEGDTPLYEYEVGSEYRLLEPEKEDFYFDGWYETSDFSTPEVRKILATDDRDFVLYAKWEPLYETRTITYDLDGGRFRSEAPSWYYEGKGVSIPEPYRKGYEFIGWYDKSLDKIIYTLNAKAYGNKTLVAKWEKIYKYSNIIYELNGGSIDEDVSTYPEEKGVVLPIPHRAGYFFRGYYLNSDFSGKVITEINSVQTGDITVYAKWVEARLENALISFYGDSISTYEGITPSDHTSRYYPSGAESIKEYTDTWWGQVLTETKATLLTNISYGATAVYYGNFQGTDLNRMAKIEVDGVKPDIIMIYLGINDVVNGRTLSEFEKAYTYMISNMKKMYPSSLIFVSTLAYERYTISRNPGLREAFSEIIRKIANTENVCLVEMCNAITESNYLQTLNDTIHPNKKGMTEFAHIAIDALNSYFNNYSYYKVNYDLDGGEIKDLVYIKDYTNLLASTYLPIPVKEGYKFLGWFDSENNKVDYILAGSKKDFNLKAKWEKIDKQDIEYQVVFYDASGAQTIKNVKGGEKLDSLPAHLISENSYVWMSDTQIINEETIITSNLEVREVWVGVSEIIKKVFPSIVFNDLAFEKTYVTSQGRIGVVWSSSDENTITKTGLVNPGREEIDVVINARFQLLDEYQNYEFKVTVGRIEFRDLSNIKPVISYMHINMGELEINSLVEETLDIAVFSFSRVTSKFTVNNSELSHMDEVFRLRKHGVRVLLCLGAYSEAGVVFSDCASTLEGRKTLANSILETIEKYHFDGVDLDWEYPGFNTGRTTSVDSVNFTLLVKEIHDTIKAKNPDYILSAAIPGGIYGYQRYELDKLNNYLDYFNVMTYDLQSESKVTHHSAMQNGQYAPYGSCKQSLELFASRGVSKNKLIVGGAFYGRMYSLTDTENVLGSTKVTSVKAITFTSIYENYISKLYKTSTQIERIWDSESLAPILVDKTNKVAITYDDQESIRLKCRFVNDNDYGGIMFWSYGEDLTLFLLSAINDEMK